MKKIHILIPSLIATAAMPLATMVGCEDDIVLHVKGVKIDGPSKVTCWKNQTLQLTCSVRPENATNKGVKWESLNANVATINEEGLVTGVNSGATLITVQTDDGKYVDSCEIEIVAPVQGVTIDGEEHKQITKGEQTTLTCTIDPEHAHDREVSWESSNNAVATIDSATGVVNAVGGGTTTITVTTHDGGFTDTCEIEVISLVESVTIENNIEQLEVVDTNQLHYNISPSDATDKSVTWVSSNTSVANVDDNGLVTAVAPGNTTITVTTNDGQKTANYTLNVVAKDSALDFYKCGWSKISAACEKLENEEWTTAQFCNRFTINEQKVTDISQFIGQKRSVFVNGIKHEVIVLDVQKDSIDAETNAALTFQFNNLISGSNLDGDADGSYLRIGWEKRWMEVGCKHYWDSTLENALNGMDEEKPVEWYNSKGEDIIRKEDQISVFAFIQRDKNDGLADIIKPVYRSVLTWNNNAWSPVEKQTKIFTPVLVNIYSTNGITKSPYYNLKKLSARFIQEGQRGEGEKQYAYYKTYIGDDAAVSAATYECLIRTECGPSHRAYWYWNNSPTAVETFDVSAFAASTFGAFDGQYSNFRHGVAPCFCL